MISRLNKRRDGPKNQQSSAQLPLCLSDMVMDPPERPVADTGIVVLWLRLCRPPDPEPERGEECGEADQHPDHGSTSTYVDAPQPRHFSSRSRPCSWMSSIHGARQTLQFFAPHPLTGCPKYPSAGSWPHTRFALKYSRSVM